MASDNGAGRDTKAATSKMSRDVPAKLITAFVIFALAVLFSIRYAPPFASVSRDSGVFLYGGRQFLMGQRPYVDFWDHKPPLIYVLNAIGLTLGKGRWGVWGLETFMFGVAVALLFSASARRLGFWPSLIGTCFIIVACRNTLFFGAGNYTEGYAACLTMLVLACVLWQPKGSFVWCLAGVAASAVLFVKQSCIGTPVAVAIILAWFGLIKREAQFRRHLTAYCIGAAILAALVLLWMGFQGLLAEFWDSNFVYSRIYVASQAHGTGMLPRWYRAFWQFDSRGILSVAAFSMISCAVALLLRSLGREGEGLRLPAWVVLAAIPLELWLMALPYRFYGHYYLVLFPLVGVGWVVWSQAVGQLSNIPVHEGSRERVKKALQAVLLLMPLCVLSGRLKITELKDVIEGSVRLQGRSANDDILEYLKTKPGGSPLLVWGAEARMNFLSGRRCPTRYSYMYPLTFEEYDQVARFTEFLRDLAAQPGTLIIDTLGDSPNCLGQVPSALPAKGVDRGFAWRAICPELMVRLRAHVADHYEPDRTFPNGWIAYVPKEGSSQESERLILSTSGMRDGRPTEGFRLEH